MDDLGFGLGVTIAGLGIVFGLLAVLWLLLTIALRLEGRRVVAPTGRGPDSSAPPSDALDPRLIAAMSIAVLRHAEARRQQAAPAMRSFWPGSLLFASRWVAAGRMRQGQEWRRRAR